MITKMASKVLTIGCSPSLEKAIQTALAGPDYEVISLADEQELINQINSVAADIILLRLAFPAEKSYDICQFLKSQPQFKDIPLVLLKGVFEPGGEELITAGSFDEVVKLPFASVLLAKLIGDLVDRRKFPSTLPEEAEIETTTRGGPAAEFEDEIRSKVKEEVEVMEKELEKRLKTQLLAEIKSWLESKWPEIKKKNENELLK